MKVSLISDELYPVYFIEVKGEGVNKDFSNYYPVADVPEDIIELNNLTYKAWRRVQDILHTYANSN